MTKKGFRQETTLQLTCRNLRRLVWSGPHHRSIYTIFCERCTCLLLFHLCPDSFRWHLINRICFEEPTLFAPGILFCKYCHELADTHPDLYSYFTTLVFGANFTRSEILALQNEL